MKKINSSGISHVILPLVAVVGVGIIGTYMLVSSNAATCKDYTFRKGTKGKCVSNIQTILIHTKSASYNDIKVNGLYDSHTKARVAGFQKINGLPADGAVGSKTWKKLCTVSSDGSQSVKSARRSSGC